MRALIYIYRKKLPKYKQDGLHHTLLALVEILVPDDVCHGAF